MEKYTSYVMAGVLAITPVLSLPLYAETLPQKEDKSVVVTEEENVTTTQEQSIVTDTLKTMTQEEEVANSSSDVEENIDAVEHISIVHTVNDGQALPATILKISDDPTFLFNAIKQNLAEQLKTNTKPVKVHTDIDLKLTEADAKEAGKLPTLTLDTEVDKDNNGKTTFTLPPYQLAVPAKKEAHGEGSINWQGLNGELTFVGEFTQPAITGHIAGLTIQEKDEFNFTLDKVDFSGSFDEDLLPTRLHIVLPKLVMQHTNEGQFTIENITLDSDSKTLESGLQLSQGQGQIGKIHFKNEEASIDLSGLSFNSDMQLEGEFVNATSNMKLDMLGIVGLIKIEPFTFDLAAQHLSAEAVLKMQQSMRTLHRQRQKGEMTEEMMSMTMLASMMEVAPMFLKNSPNISLTNLQLNTSDGGLMGELHVGIDGSQYTALDETLLQALKANVNIEVGKGILEKIFAIQSREQILAMAAAQGQDEPDAAQLASKIKQMVEMQIAMLVATKMLVTEGDDKYKLVASLDGDEFIVNGQKMPSPAMLLGISQSQAMPEKEDETTEEMPADKDVPVPAMQ